ncbi:ABC transporter permease [Aeromicrobium alkaliterrae]|uniref:ABC transporter permease n=2 Tax=Aeromicrobium alkaliterrae TaxID=302168 RepID=A0ABN2KF49_9ACTN
MAESKSRKAARRRYGRLAPRVTVLAVLLGGWWAFAAAGVISEDLVPTPLGTVRAWAELVVTAEYWNSILETLRGAAAGLLFAMVIGVPIGLLTGTYAALERCTRVLFDVLRTFPGIAMLPVFLLILGATFTMKAVVVFIACVFIIVLQAQYGARSVTPTIRETVRAYRIPKRLWFRRVVLPSSIPSIMTGLRLAAALSVLVAIGVEVLTTVPGIGFRVTEAQLGNDSSSAWAYILTAGVLGFLIVVMSELAESRLLRWRPSSRLEM